MTGPQDLSDSDHIILYPCCL